MSEPTEKIKLEKQKGGNKLTSIVVTIVVLGLVVFSGWSFNSYRKAEKEVLRLSTVEGQQEILENELDDLLDNVRRHLVLPEDEQPTVATISDIEILSEDQPFFEGADNGDKVIVYTQASKAIIYSPQRDVIINVGTVFVDNEEVELEDVSADEEGGEDALLEPEEVDEE